MLTKICSKCSECKNITEFNKKSSVKNGYMSECRLCNKQRRKKDKEHIAQYNKQYVIKNRVLVREGKKRWKLKNFHLDIFSTSYANLKGLHNVIVGMSILRKYILNRDRNCCQLCYNNLKLQIHHIFPTSKDSSAKFILDPKTIITLCQACHLKAHNGNFRCLNEQLVPVLLKIVEVNELTIEQ